MVEIHPLVFAAKERLIQEQGALNPRGALELLASNIVELGHVPTFVYPLDVNHANFIDFRAKDLSRLEDHESAFILRVIAAKMFKEINIMDSSSLNFQQALCYDCASKEGRKLQLQLPVSVCRYKSASIYHRLNRQEDYGYACQGVVFSMRNYLDDLGRNFEHIIRYKKDSIKGRVMPEQIRNLLKEVLDKDYPDLSEKLLSD